MGKNISKILQRFRVPIGFFFAAVFLIFAKPELKTMIIGAVISLAGLAVRAWAAGHIRKNKLLATSGPYAYTRNPLYFGSFLLGAGFAIGSGIWWLVPVFVLLFLGIYLPVMHVESEELTALFGEDFLEYAKKVPMFFPRLTVWRKYDENFDFELYLRYREYRAAMGLVFAWGVLALKAFFLR